MILHPQPCGFFPWATYSDTKTVLGQEPEVPVPSWQRKPWGNSLDKALPGPPLDVKGRESPETGQEASASGLPGAATSAGRVGGEASGEQQQKGTRGLGDRAAAALGSDSSA